MRTNILVSIILIFFLSLNAFAQRIHGYKFKTENSSEKSEIKDQNKLSKVHKVTVNTGKDTLSQISEFVNLTGNEKIVFKESFSNDVLDNTWIANSGTNNMKAVNDSVHKKVLKISSDNPNGDSFLEYDLTDKLRGKKIRLKALIKTDNIRRGAQIFEVGQLCIKFKVDNIVFYEAVQNLVGSMDWAEHSAHEDGRYSLDNTDNGEYAFYIPENATNIILYLGLQNCTGSIYFKDVEVSEVQ